MICLNLPYSISSVLSSRAATMAGGSIALCLVVVIVSVVSTASPISRIMQVAIPTARAVTGLVVWVAESNSHKGQEDGS